jgi:hypothetical protein
VSETTLIAGRLRGKITTRITKNVDQVTQFKLRVASHNFMEHWEVWSYDKRTADELSSLDDGDAVCAAGSLRLGLFDCSGEKRIKRNLVASRIVALKPVPLAHLEAEISAIEEAKQDRV